MPGTVTYSWRAICATCQADTGPHNTDRSAEVLAEIHVEAHPDHVVQVLVETVERRILRTVGTHAPVKEVRSR